jgi:uncharacterized OB-fold protein
MPPARSWREYPRRYRYEAGVCKQCGKWFFPPRLVCDACGAREFETKVMQRTGTILTHTVIRVPPAPFSDQAPYAVAVVEMDDGPRITTMVADYRDDELRVGQKVRLEFRKISEEGQAGTINYGYKAVPI